MPDTTTITCPKCGEKIPLTDALTHDLKEQLTKEMGESIRQEYEKKMDSERAALRKEAEKRAREEAGAKFKDLELANAEKDQKLQEAGQREMDFMKQKRELEEKAKSVDLEVARKVEEERKKIEESAQTRATEESRLQIKAKDEQMEQMRKTIDDLKRKSEQGSMQIQGEVQEDDLRDSLIAAFTTDTVEDVPQGVKGADLIHTVRTRTGMSAGTLLWESKNTKNWVGDWIKKLKDDQVQAKADICVIVTQALPEGVRGFGHVEGVWVTDPAHVLLLTNVLRHQLIQLAQVKASLVGKDEKMEILYEYLISTQFKNRVENIVRAFQEMHEELHKEKRATERMWARREKELERVMKNTVGMYGDFQGLIGTALPVITSLELPSGEETHDIGENNTTSL